MLCVHTHLCFEWCRLGYEPVSVTIKWWLFALVWWHSLLVVVFVGFAVYYARTTRRMANSFDVYSYELTLLILSKLNDTARYKKLFCFMQSFLSVHEELPTTAAATTTEDIYICSEKRNTFIRRFVWTFLEIAI